MDIKKWLVMAIMAFSLVFMGCDDSDSTPNEDANNDDANNDTNNDANNDDANVEKKLNFIPLVIDDMGFSDLGVYGGEIDTPNMDQLANKGIMLTNFYASPTSTPTRGMLFTGKDHHDAGVGTMPSAVAVLANVVELPEGVEKLTDLPAYKSHLNLDALPFPELLKDNGYHTMMTGKWDLAEGEFENPAYYPSSRGFKVTRAALLGGGGYHYSDEDGKPQNGTYVNNGEVIEEFPKQFYSS